MSSIKKTPVDLKPYHCIDRYSYIHGVKLAESQEHAEKLLLSEHSLEKQKRHGMRVERSYEPMLCDSIRPDYAAQANRVITELDAMTNDEFSRDFDQVQQRLHPEGNHTIFEEMERL